jgi:hypothetical protein
MIYPLLIAGTVAGAMSSWPGGMALWAGNLSANIIVLFVKGPGTIFPIVLAVATALTALSVLIGASVGTVIRMVLRRVWRRVD